MGSSKIQYLTETEQEVIQLLIEIGLKTNEARLLVVFFRGIDSNSRDIERITDLRQPEVSVAITGLTKRNWVTVSSLITINKGRPVKIYSLAQPIDDILDGIRGRIGSGHDEQVAMLKRIREIIRH